ncbi:TetR/AcrR family transcriptional regulator [Roseobacter sp.]|uniref:TetR/AcrR family transcriptional regulator n=1 Tax=Roseobacter sp. TaxID=1907202 RepID=UPI00385CF890
MDVQYDINGPTGKARHGNSKVTREDWLRAARDILVTVGVGDVKITSLSARLGVARSSFYWYFKDRADVLKTLLEEWEARNTQCIVDKCGLEADSVGQAVCNFFECFIDQRLFDQGLDFAVRDWSRRDPTVRTKIDSADALRLQAIERLFLRHGFDAAEADARARILYFMQLGYHALEVVEPLDVRMDRLEGYLKGFTGEQAAPGLVTSFRARFFELGAKV